MKISSDDEPSLKIQSLPGMRELVTERMRLAIASGRFPPGTRLIERELCDMLGVSRSSLREAMRELQADGLITLQPNKGLSVSVISYEMAVSIYQVRAMLEGLSARLFVLNATDRQMADLGRSLDRLADVYDNFSSEAFIAAKSSFYDILLEGSGNMLAADMLRRVHTRVSLLRVMSLSNPERARKSIRELREFYAALVARDQELAWTLCVAHVENAAKAALAALKETPP
ncbi:GntR family transcriptional regulator [Kaistia dalseonensis]|uniref:DNA-binding GntR family transcriptional regulator n=1 Tax=Kaistia dalseonensis TaxID=410840 RepID=A0ABU0H8M0_9HYPH|nr:GntR family transcriptional regulator [Kaistia dalseonensis]MCX5495615.1 GntR family transcriptional regulator [Kaistia dalseonensis]MDQ0438208.1 DNA-binding GntR family transcriptional regulator [Kaistia dalseonensis]